MTLLLGPGPLDNAAGDSPPLPPLLEFLNEYPDLFKEEILGRLDPRRGVVMGT